MSGRSAAWERTWVGTKGSGVQIPAPRPITCLDYLSVSPLHRIVCSRHDGTLDEESGSVPCGEQFHRAGGKDAMVPEKASLTARVIGRVQGVGFRYFTERVAEEIGLAGYVMNRSDGSVEVMAEGGRSHLEQLLEPVEQGRAGAPRGGVA